MFDSLKEKLGLLFGRSSSDDNLKISKKQKAIGKFLLFVVLAVAAALVILVEEKTKEQPEEATSGPEEGIVNVELPDKGLDTELHWRNHYDDQRAKDKKEIEQRLKEMEESQVQLISKANALVEEELKATKLKLQMAQRELASASLDLKRVAKEEGERLSSSPQHSESAMNMQSFSRDVEFDKPKSAANYVPEGTYFTGNLLGGIVVSTALNTPDENATPVTIQLRGRFNHKGERLTNLSPLNKINIEKCRIMGSAYGDLSSERAVVRLEKMVCEENNMYVTSKIAGQLFGPDGFNGIKGTVVATSSKHIKNAMIGGMISGLSSSAKGQEGLTLGAGGMLATKSKGAKEMFGQGAMQGASNAGEKLADYYLRQAESMSPVLTIAPAAKVSAQITKGFYVGEVGTHRKIQDAREQNGGKR